MQKVHSIEVLWCKKIIQDISKLLCIKMYNMHVLRRLSLFSLDHFFLHHQITTMNNSNRVPWYPALGFGVQCLALALNIFMQLLLQLLLQNKK